MYLEAREPWRAIKVDRDAAAVTIRTALGLVRLYGHLSSPFIPGTSEVLATVLPEADSLQGVSGALAPSVLELAAGAAFVGPGLLFRKIDDDTIAEWIERFGGTAAVG